MLDCFQSLRSGAIASYTAIYYPCQCSRDCTRVYYMGNGDGWGSRRTPILEFDQIYGNHWDWTAGSGSSADAFDFANVATHGIGNAVGLDHPGNSCTEETMYAYVDFGETKKRDLNAGDILGVQALTDIAVCKSNSPATCRAFCLCEPVPQESLFHDLTPALEIV